MRAALFKIFLSKCRLSYPIQPQLLSVKSWKLFENLTENYASSTNNQSEFLCHLLGITRAQAMKLISRNRSLKYIERSRLQQTILLLKDLKFNYSHILQYPKIFNIHPSIIVQRYQCLKEFGFSNISLNHVLRYPTIVRCSLNDLKEQGVLSENLDPLGALINCTCGPPDLDIKLKHRYGTYLIRSSLEKMRCAVILDYLSWQLNASLEDVCHLMENYPVLIGFSLQTLHRVWTVLTRNCSFNVEIIKNNGYLLTLMPGDMLQLLEQFPHLGGLGIRVLALECPKLLTLQGKRIGLSEDILRKNGITDEQIARCAEIFLIDPAQLHSRLAEIKSVPELEILQSHPQFLWIVYNNPSFKGKQPRSHNPGIADVSLLRWCSSPSEILRTYTVKQHDDQPPEQQELEMYLADRLNRSLEKIKLKLMFNSEWTKMSLQKTSELLSFLEQKGFTQEQIFNALPQVMMQNDYIQDEIMEVLTNMDTEQYVESFSHPHGLQKLLSMIEDKEKPKQFP